MSDYTNSGVLFPNDRKTSDRAPTLTGKINVNGKEYRLAGWTKTGNKGKFISLKISEFEDRQQGQQPAAAQAAARAAELDDEIPF